MAFSPDIKRAIKAHKSKLQVEKKFIIDKTKDYLKSNNADTLADISCSLAIGSICIRSIYEIAYTYFAESNGMQLYGQQVLSGQPLSKLPLMPIGKNINDLQTNRKIFNNSTRLGYLQQPPVFTDVYNAIENLQPFKEHLVGGLIDISNTAKHSGMKFAEFDLPKYELTNEDSKLSFNGVDLEIKAKLNNPKLQFKITLDDALQFSGNKKKLKVSDVKMSGGFQSITIKPSVDTTKKKMKFNWDYAKSHGLCFLMARDIETPYATTYLHGNASNIIGRGKPTDFREKSINISKPEYCDEFQAFFFQKKIYKSEIEVESGNQIYKVNPFLMLDECLKLAEKLERACKKHC